MRRLLLVALLAAISQPVTGRLFEKDWSFQEMFDKSDLVVIAKPVSTKDTDERSTLLDLSPLVRVLGVNTEFETRLVLKGDTKVRRFVLHHYRAEHNEPSVNGPALVTFDSKKGTPFLLFLIKESDGRYAPVTGQTDPGLFSVVEVESTAE